MKTAQFLQVQKNIVEQAKAKNACDKLEEVIIDKIWWCVKMGVFLPDGHYSNNKRKFTIYNGKLHGKYIHFFGGGVVDFESNYDNGVEQGESISYHLNGKIAFKYNTLNGQRDGECFRYNSDGEVIKVSMYHKGLYLY